MGRRSSQVGHRWRDYRTPAGARPVKKFLDDLSIEDRAEVAAAMAEVRMKGLRFARHLQGDIYEVRAEGRRSVRILFSQEGEKGRVMLALEGFEKKTQKTPDHLIRLAEKRLADWRAPRAISLTISHVRDSLVAMTERDRGAEPDFLDELIAEGEAEHPGFTLLVDAALERRRLLRELAEDRVELGLSQTAVAAEMGTSQSAVARIESGNGDVKMSTVERYAATLGRKVQWRIAPAGRGAATARKSVAEASSSRGKKAATKKR